MTFGNKTKEVREFVLRNVVLRDLHCSLYTVRLNSSNMTCFSLRESGRGWGEWGEGACSTNEAEQEYFLTFY
jgi:hypothetical protein